MIPEREELVRNGVIRRTPFAATQHFDNLRVLQALKLSRNRVKRKPCRAGEVGWLGRATAFHKGVNDFPLLRWQVFHLVLEQRCQFVHQPLQLLNDGRHLLEAKKFIEHEHKARIAAGQMNERPDLGLLLRKLAEEAVVPVELRTLFQQLGNLVCVQAVERHLAEVIEERLVVTLERFEKMNCTADDHH